MSQDLFSLRGRTALVTGGGTGLGRAFAHTLATAGARVVLAARRTAPLEDTAAAIRAAGGEALCVSLDVADAAAIELALDAAAAFGTIDILVNNAGTAADKPLLDVAEDDWDRVMDANLKGAWLVARAVARRLIAGGRGGSIVNIGSILGDAVQKATVPYGASKAALLQLTRGMAIEWARHGIRANAILPGYFRTDISAGFLDSPVGQAMLKRVPQRRLGEPPELAGALLLLASDAGRYMTGTSITVDGGLSLPTV